MHIARKFLFFANAVGVAAEKLLVNTEKRIVRKPRKGGRGWGGGGDIKMHTINNKVGTLDSCIT